jgi:hypothetical protein
MSGGERGDFWEIPLHIAFIFTKVDDGDVLFHKMFNDIWKSCPNLHDAQYTDALYEGENILHLAIIRNFGKYIDHILDLEQRDKLLKHHAVGNFFKESTLIYGCRSSSPRAHTRLAYSSTSSTMVPISRPPPRTRCRICSTS